MVSLHRNASHSSLANFFLSKSLLQCCHAPCSSISWRLQGALEQQEEGTSNWEILSLELAMTLENLWFPLTAPLCLPRHGLH